MNQLAAIAEYVSHDSPIYAERLVDRLVARLQQATAFPNSGRVVPELPGTDIRELIDPPYRQMYRQRSDCIEVLAIAHSRQSVRGVP